MKKQAKNRIFKSVLLLVSVVAVITSIAIFAFAVAAIEEPTSQLELIFEEDRFYCYIETRKDNNSPWETYLETTKGGIFEVPYSEPVRLRVVANTGEWAEFAVEGETVYSIGTTDDNTANTVVWSPYKKKATVTITCVNRTYKVLPLDYDLGTYETLTGHPWKISDWKKGNKIITYQYGTDTELPTVVMEDHTFKGWNIVMGDGSVTPAIVKDSEGNKQYFIPQDLSRTTYFDNGIIYVYPNMEPFTYPVYRQDVVYDTSRPNNLGNFLFDSETTEREYFAGKDIFANTENFWGDDVGGFKSYIGYLLKTDINHSTTVKDPVAFGKKDINTVYRYYAPIKYRLDYRLNANGDSSVKFDTDNPEIYTYANTTYIGKPSRTGFAFNGWLVEIYTAKDGWVVVPGGLEVDSMNPERYVLGDKQATYDKTGRNDPNAKYASEAQENDVYEIRLTAQWSAIPYDIKFDWGKDVLDRDVSENLIQNKNSLPTSFTFGETCFIPNPILAGYTFTGWTLTYDDLSVPAADGLTKVDGGYELDGSLHANHIQLTANWAVESYKVVLDTDGTIVGEFFGVEYDKKMPIEAVIVPEKLGHNFKGYYSAPNGGGEIYIDATGIPVDKAWKIDGGETGDTITLYACWERKEISITVLPIDKVPGDVTVTIYDLENNTPIPYLGTPITLLFNTEFYVEIELPTGFKIVEWNDVLLDNVHDGNTFQSETMRIETEDAITLSALARPGAPQIGVGEGKDITSIMVESDTSIKVNFANADVAKRYEVAISLNGETIPGDDEWKKIADGESYYLLTELASGEKLNPGTIYYVFIRLKEIENVTNSGIPAIEDKLTKHDAYVNETIANLNGMFKEGDGKITQGLINGTVGKIEALSKSNPLPDDFYEQIEKWVAEVEAKIAFTRYQDAKIAALQAFLMDCLNSGSFSEANIAELDILCREAVGKISAQDETESEVDDTYNAAIAAMKAIPVNYLYAAGGAMKLESLLGLSQDSGISFNSIEDIKALRRAVADAIAAGKITADSFITIEEATELLRTLDTIGAYNFYLSNVQPAKDDTFTFTMIIPEALVGRTGLQVAYYNTATGMVEFLETTVDGNRLIFRAKQVSDFVILADPTVDLTAVMVALGVIALCQLIAIALVLAARSKAKNAVRHASVALPMFLTIHFLPVNAELIVLALGVVVLLLQIVLMWLSISSGMIRVFKKRSTSAPREIPTVVREEDLHEDPSHVFDEEDESVEEESGIDEPVTDEESTETEETTEEESSFDEEALDEDAFDEELAEELARESAEEDEYVEEGEYVEEAVEELSEEVSEAEEVYDDEEFIEHTPNPYYSLDDEEDAYAHTEEETERVSDVDTTDQETEETSYGEDPLDGVFGEADVPDGDSGDEGGSPFDEDSYAESYEYGDEADASYAETEDADGEETSGEGSVDAASYIVDDDEELSDDEEMYQYDE